jgi:uncharacterized membrane protein
MRHTHAPGTQRDTGRIETFSDGVFAIAMTLLILEIRVPQPPGPTEPVDLTRALLDLWPSYLAYVLSFVTIGIYWARHHYIFKLYTNTDHALNLLNLLFLMCICFLPFPTEVLARFMHDGANQKVAATFYVVSLVLPAATWTTAWLYASRGYRLLDRHLSRDFVRRLTIQYLVTVALYAGAALVSLFSFRMGLAICVGLTLLYLLPPRKPVYVHEAQAA